MDVIEPRLVCVNGGRYRFFESDFWSAENDSFETTSAENHDFQPFNDQSDEEFDESLAEKLDAPSAGEFDDLYAEKVDANAEGSNDAIAEESDEIVNRMSESTNDGKTHDSKEEKATDIRVFPLPKSGYLHTFVVNKRFYPIIIGRKGDIKKKLEMRTSTVIVVPRAHEDDEVSIKGPTIEAVISARRQLDMIINDAKRYVGNIETFDSLPASNFKKIDSSDDAEFDATSAESFDGCNAGEFHDPDAESVTDSNAEESDIIGNQMSKSANDRKTHDDEEEKTTDIHIVPLPKSGYIHTFIVNRRFYPIIVGRQGAIKNKLEMKTNTVIVVPRAHGGDEISIKGPSKEAVISARRQLDSIINDARRYVGNIEAVAPLTAGNAKNIDSFDNEEFGESFVGNLDGCNAHANPEKSDKIVDQTIKEEKTTDIHIVPLPKSGYQHTFIVNKRFYPIIVGRQGATKNKLEIETDTVIVVPRAQEGNEIVIKGPSEETVILARRKLDMIIKDAKRYVGNIEAFAPLPAANTKNIDSFDNKEFGESVAENFDGCNAGGLGDLDAKSANDRKTHDIQEEKTTDIHLVPLPKSGYIHTFVVNKRFYPIIVGRQGAIKNKLEMETNTVIVVPRAHEGDEISIKGPSKEAVISARRQLDSIINDARRYVGNIEAVAPLPASNAKSIDSCDNEEVGKSFAEKFDGCNAGEFNDADRERVARSNAEKSDKIVDQISEIENDQESHDIEEGKTTDIHIVPLPKSGYQHTFIVNKRFYPIIVGRQGATKKKLEIETNTVIVVPRGHEGNEISIKGPSEEAVISARRQLDWIINDARRYVGKIEDVAPSPASNAKNIDSSDGLQNAQIRSHPSPPNSGATTANNSYEVTETSNPELPPELPPNQPIKNASYSPETKTKSSSTSNHIIEPSIPRSVSSRKHTYTHFLSIPMTSETVMSNYLKFTNALLEGSSKDFPGVRPEVFRKPAKLHVALGMLSLRNDEAVAAAAMALEECKEKIIKPIIEKMGPITIRVQGLKGAFFEPYYIKVLYAQILTKNNVLLQIAQNIEEYLVCAGLMERPAKKLEIHMTLMNTSFDQRNPSKKFNARNIVKDYKDYFFGEIKLNTIYISKRGEYAENGYYSTSVQEDVP